MLAQPLTLTYGWLRGYELNLLLDLTVCAHMVSPRAWACALRFESSALRIKRNVMQDSHSESFFVIGIVQVDL